MSYVCIGNRRFSYFANSHVRSLQPSSLSYSYFNSLNLTFYDSAYNQYPHRLLPPAKSLHPQLRLLFLTALVCGLSSFRDTPTSDDSVGATVSGGAVNKDATGTNAGSIAGGVIGGMAGSGCCWFLSLPSSLSSFYPFSHCLKLW